MRLRAALFVSTFVLVASSVSAEPAGPTLSWSELSKMPLPAAVPRVPYGSRPQQFGELRVPAGAGLFPVFIVIHGGCWQAEFDLTYSTRLAAWLTQNGFATWTIEYRRLGDDGGGWPGTFLDVANAADALREIAKTKPLDVSHVYAAGHSAGGQLALWLASRKHLSKESELFIEHPIGIRGVLGLAAITDLYEYRKGPPQSCNASVEPLLGGTPDAVPNRYEQSSPLQRLPLGIPQVFIQGERDSIVTPASVRAYVDAAKHAGDSAELLAIPQIGHFETSVAIRATEEQLRAAIQIVSGQ
jgi:acetyl esterase/lipase